MAHKFDPQNKDRLLSPERRERLDPDRLLSLLPLRPYQIVADIGCGPGYFSLPLAKYLYDGKLYAVDVQEEMLAAARERLGKFRLSNVEFIKSEENSIDVPAASLDGALLAFVLHEAEDRKAFLSMVAGLLQRASWMSVLEWYKQETENGPPAEHRVSPEEVKELTEAVGLRFTSERSLNGQQYMLMFRA